jgi:glycosyltransferase involved in cell wall biosynthesis
MKVSIITATNNSEKTIEDCIKSLIGQVYMNIEFIIIDNNSTDLTLNIIDRYKLNNNNIKLISESDKGLYDALNKGISYACGDIVGFLHSDDVFYDCYSIFDVVSFFRDKKSDGVFGDLQYVNKENTNKIIRLWKSCEFQPELLKKGWMPAHPTLFLRKHVYDKHLEFNRSFKISADYDFMLRILKDKTLNFGYLPRVITKMRVGGASNRSIKNIIKKSKEDYRAIRSNNIGGVITLLLKNTSKIKQFLIKKS